MKRVYLSTFEMKGSKFMLGRFMEIYHEILIRMGGVNLQRGDNHIGSLIVRKSKQAAINIGCGFSVRHNVILNVSEDGVLRIGEKVFINDGCKINVREKVTIESGCMIGQDVLIYDHDHDYMSDNRHKRFITAPIHIGKNVWIGSGVIILKGVNIGDNAVIAAGCLVKEDIPSDILFYRKMGTPQIKRFNSNTD